MRARGVRLVSPAFYWLALLVGVIGAILIPALIWERWLRSDYRSYVRHQRTLEAWRDVVVKGPALPHHNQLRSRPRIVKQGQVR